MLILSMGSEFLTRTLEGKPNLARENPKLIYELLEDNREFLPL